MTLMKVYDRYEMPRDIQELFAKAYEKDNREPLNNESYVLYDAISDWATDRVVTKWFLDNGANIGESILIRWWW
jgi:hypothetical protein